MSDEYYGEVPGRPPYVSLELMEAAQKALDFCKRHYGDPSREGPLLKWIRKNKTDYIFEELKDNIRKAIYGKGASWRERSYEKIKPVYGFVKRDLSGSGSIFIDVETPFDLLVNTVGHEFYHWRFGRINLTAERQESEEKEAKKFGKQIEREMLAEARREDDERWRRRYRELTRR